MKAYKNYLPEIADIRFASSDEIHESSVKINPSDIKACGIPLSYDGKNLSVDNSDSHTIIYGSTGSKKTRTFGFATINTILGAGESIIVTDPKGELYRKTSGFAEMKGYQILTIDFREMSKSNSWNPLSLPYKLYKAGKFDEAVANVNDFIDMIAAPHYQSASDRYWIDSAASACLGIVLIMFKLCKESEINLSTLSRMCLELANENETDKNPVLNLLSSFPQDSIVYMNLMAVISTPDRTKACIQSSLFAMIKTFMMNRELINMTAKTDFDIYSISKKKTAVYLIVPDEKDTFNGIAGFFIKQTYETLIAEAYRYKDNCLRVRVNFLLEEFCNIPKIPNFANMLSAGRSRKIRFFLFVQSKTQLVEKYERVAPVIQSNCQNLIFITSRELELLSYISDLCGSNNGAPLLSIDALQRFKKERDYSEVLIFHDRCRPYVACLPDIDKTGFRCYDEISRDKKIYQNCASVDFNLLSKRHDEIIK